MHNARNLIKTSGIFWEKKPEPNGISPDEKRETMGKIKNMHNEAMKNIVPYYADASVIGKDDNSREKKMAEAIKRKYGESLSIPSLKRGNLDIIGENGRFVDEVIDKINTNKEHKKNYLGFDAYKFDMIDKGKSHAEKMVSEGNVKNLELPRFDDKGIMGEIDKEEALGKRKEMFRKARNAGRIGLAGVGLTGAGIYGASKLSSKDKDKR